VQILIKVAVSVGIILTATALARRFPAAAGLIGVMPLTGALVLVWVYVENSGSQAVLEGFVRGALWGILPSILFFLSAYFCVKRGLSLPALLAVGFAVWLAAAVVHQWIVK
jgi:uncharacterized membrane protein (GlpM family)